MKDIAQKIKERDRVIVRTSITGITANVLLAAFKAVVGMLTHSIAVTMDAVNNLTDALSSVITIAGTKLAGRRPDKKHPLGHGRYEYLSTMIISVIVLYAGVTALTESLKKIPHPEQAEYSSVSLVIMAAAVIVKILLGLYVKRQGVKVESGALAASGRDALFDAVLSASVLGSAIIYIVSGISLEAYVGALIAVFIIRAGIDMIRETMDDILGKRPDAEMTAGIKALITEFPEVRGVYDLILNNYGPNKNYASVHVELPDTMRVDQVDVLTRQIEEKVYRETGVILTGIGVYSFNTKNEQAAEIRYRVQHLVMEHPWALQMHGFYVDMQEKTMRFDVVLSFDVMPEKAAAELYEEVQKVFPEYTLQIVPDLDITDV